MKQIVAVHMEGSLGLQHVSKLKWVEVAVPGGPAQTYPQDNSRAEFVSYVRANPKSAFALSSNDGTYAFLEVVEANPPYVKTLPDSTKSDNLLSLPRF